MYSVHTVENVLFKRSPSRGSINYTKHKTSSIFLLWSSSSRQILWMTNNHILNLKGKFLWNYIRKDLFLPENACSYFTGSPLDKYFGWQITTFSICWVVFNETISTKGLFLPFLMPTKELHYKYSVDLCIFGLCRESYDWRGGGEGYLETCFHRES